MAFFLKKYSEPLNYSISEECWDSQYKKGMSGKDFYETRVSQRYYVERVMIEENSSQ